ncbi:MAG: hypothetical protein LBS60_02135 [Deltaproteobacteria bacterium]|jgi:intracellular multiplication protein IcmB|nr:hypothetical protein [Deltaproteobacteria bacterium]
MSFYDAFNRFTFAAYELFKGPAMSFCRLETLDNVETLVADDGSLISALKISGTVERITAGAFEKIRAILTEKTRVFLEKPGQSLKLVFEYDPSRAAETLERSFLPSKATANALNLDLNDVLNGWEKRLLDLAAGENLWLVLWTDVSLLEAIDRKNAWNNRLKVLNVTFFWPGQKEGIGLPELKEAHLGTLAALSEALTEAGLINRQLSGVELLRDIRTSLFPSLTPKDWRPYVPDLDRPFIMPERGQGPEKVLVYPSLDDQLFPRRAVIKNRDFVLLGDRLHAPFFLAIPPREPRPFNELFRGLSRLKRPWRLALDLANGGLGHWNVQSLLARIFALTSVQNRQLNAALEYLKKERDAGSCLVTLSFSFDTWVEVLDYPNLEAAELALKRQLAALERLCAGWGQSSVQEVTGDPLLGVAATLPGLMPKSPAPRALAPLAEAWSFLPLRPAGAWDQGPLVFLSPDGKPLPFRPNSSNQAAWIDLGVAPMGAGKSVLLNSLNLAFCLQPGLDKLPLLSIIDVGPSSMGLIALLKSALPPALKPLVTGFRLRATPEYAINPLDAPLGFRTPLPSHLGFLINLICLLATPLGQAAPPDGVAGVARVALEGAYAAASNPGKLFDPSLEPTLTKAAQENGFPADQNSTFWDLTDFFFQKGLISYAHLAQRLATPTLADVIAQVRQHPSLKATYAFKVALTGENILDFVWRSLTEALGEYKILANPTRFSPGEARVICLDLDEVAPRGGGPAGDKRAAVMYMLARHAVGARFFHTPEDIHLTPALYQAYHQESLQNLRRTPKRLCYDEIHRLTGLKAASAQLVGDLTTSARESRKWNLSIGLYSQTQEDFPEVFQELATSIFVLGAGTEKSLAALQSSFGLNEAVTLELSRLPPPGPKGSSLAAIFKTRSGKTQDLLTLALSPELRWAFSTTAEDAAIRDALYQKFGVFKTLSHLAQKWPGGLKSALEEKSVNLSIGERKSGEIDPGDLLTELIKETAAHLAGGL